MTTTASTGAGVALESVTTDQLRPGDVIHDMDMCLVIDRPITDRPATGGGRVYFTDARIGNWDALVAAARKATAAGALYETAVMVVRHAVQDADGVRRWYVQGNASARWAREIAA